MKGGFLLSALNSTTTNLLPDLPLLRHQALAVVPPSLLFSLLHPPLSSLPPLPTPKTSSPATTRPPPLKRSLDRSGEKRRSSLEVDKREDSR
jgi:hypothetical protein